MMCNNNLTILEILPNEILLDICKYFTARELYFVFYPLNHRFKILIESLSDLHLSITDNEYECLNSFPTYQITKLSIDRIKYFDIHQFLNIRSLKWISPSNTQLQQMSSSTSFPFLNHLSVYNMHTSSSTAQFHQFIFTNGFPHLRKCCLSRIDISLPWLLSPSLYSISICDVHEPLIIQRILTACQNLTRLDLKIQRRRLDIPMSNNFQHGNLRKLYLQGNLSMQSMNNIFRLIPVLTSLNLNSSIRERPMIYFQHLSNSFHTFLPYLNRFDCEFQFNEQYEEFQHMKPILEQFHLCFIHHLHFTKLDYGRIHISTK
jgi:hypothetical protein